MKFVVGFATQSIERKMMCNAILADGRKSTLFRRGDFGQQYSMRLILMLILASLSLESVLMLLLNHRQKEIKGKTFFVVICAVY